MYKEQFSFLIKANWSGPKKLDVFQFSLAQRRLKYMKSCSIDISVLLLINCFCVWFFITL